MFPNTVSGHKVRQALDLGQMDPGTSFGDEVILGGV